MIVDRALTSERMKRGKKYKYFVNKAVVIVYGHSPCLLNVTGLNSKLEIEEVKFKIENEFGVKCIKLRIDNIFFSHKERSDRKVSLWHLFYFFKGYCPKGYYVDYHVEIFPGMFLKSNFKYLPTILLFSSGSYSIIGGKSFNSVKRAKILVNKLFSLKYI